MGKQDAAKKQLRKEMRALRDSLGAAERARIDAGIAENVIGHEAYRAADALFTYLSVGAEVDTREIIHDAWNRGKLVAIPRCVPGTRQMQWYAIDDFDNLVVTSMGVEEPAADPGRIVEVPPAGSATNALAIVPGFTFDAQGYRMGYGGGFYDTFLPTFGGKSAGLCRAAQFSDAPVIRDDHDCAVDFVFTESDCMEI